MRVEELRAGAAALVRRLTEALTGVYGPPQSRLERAIVRHGVAGENAEMLRALARYRADLFGAATPAADITNRFVLLAQRQALADAAALVATVAGQQVIAADVAVANAAAGPLRELLEARAVENGDRVARTLAEGIARGQAPDRTARQMRQAAGGALRNAQLIARTETLRAHRTATLATYQTNPVVEQWRWSSRLIPDRTCAACWARHGQIFPITTPMGSHPACLCVPEPVVDGLAPLASGETRLRRLPVADQRQVLGPSRWQAWHDGAFPLSEVAVATRSQLWGPGLRTRSLTELVGAAEASRLIAATRAA